MQDIVHTPDKGNDTYQNCNWLGFQYFLKFHRGLEVSRGYNSDALSPDQPQIIVQPNQIQGQVQSRLTSATPTMQQRIKALGVATPLAMSSPVRR